MAEFKSVRTPKSSDRIADQIKSAILKKIIKPGDRLPSERELAIQFQASRISVREALKRLENSGLLAIMPGSGVFVSEISSKPIRESLSAILQIQSVTINEFSEARISFEPGIARLACERMAEEDLIKLEQNIKEASEMVESKLLGTAKNIEFHTLIAATTHNPVIALTMKNMFDVMEEWTLGQTGNVQIRTETSKQAIHWHRKIVEAFRERDSEKVYELMSKHTLQIQERFKRRNTP